MSPVRGTRLIACAVVASLTTLVAGAGAASASPSPKALLTDLSSPKGLTLAPNGDPVVAQGAFGAPGPVVEYVLRGRDRGTVVPLTDPLGLVDVAANENGTGWGLGEGVLYFRALDGTVSTVLDICAYQKTDPDPYDQDGDPVECNPYGLGVLPNGDALVADAANNDIVRVARDGSAKTVARFDLTDVSTSHLDDPGLPPTLPAEAVPTTVTVGPDGYIYVGQLPGYPFRPGSAHVWRINPRAEGVLCSVTESQRGCSVYAKGFTAIQDIAFNPRNETLYVYELAAEGVLPFEAAMETGQFPPAVLLAVDEDGKRTELAKGQLSQPGGIAVGRNGTLYVTDNVFTGGRLLQIETRDGDDDGDRDHDHDRDRDHHDDRDRDRDRDRND